mmetsp:Transcript_62112/g.152826  ORF Transcript_62112/g.152826 Transcript_62112/m.152826 type:complete len:312 (-) Transcript_62112:1157-2092(-)
MLQRRHVPGRPRPLQDGALKPSPRELLGEGGPRAPAASLLENTLHLPQLLLLHLPLLLFKDRLRLALRAWHEEDAPRCCIDLCTVVQQELYHLLIIHRDRKVQHSLPSVHALVKQFQGVGLAHQIPPDPEVGAIRDVDIKLAHPILGILRRGHLCGGGPLQRPRVLSRQPGAVHGRLAQQHRVGVGVILIRVVVELFAPQDHLLGKHLEGLLCVFLLQPKVSCVLAEHQKEAAVQRQVAHDAVRRYAFKPVQRLRQEGCMPLTICGAVVELPPEPLVHLPGRARLRVSPLLSRKRPTAGLGVLLRDVSTHL